MKTLFTKTERCKSCGYCIRECPTKAISFSGQLNKEGYEYIAVNAESCVLCGTCYTVCPDLVFELCE